MFVTIINKIKRPLIWRKLERDIWDGLEREKKRRNAVIKFNFKNFKWKKECLRYHLFSLQIHRVETITGEINTINAQLIDFCVSKSRVPSQADRLYERGIEGLYLSQALHWLQIATRLKKYIEDEGGIAGKAHELRHLAVPSSSDQCMT